MASNELKQQQRSLTLTGLPIRIIIFFAQNPDEILAIKDVSEKWGVAYLTAQRAMLRLYEVGWVAKADETVGRSVLYEAGPLIRKELQ